MVAQPLPPPTAPRPMVRALPSPQARGALAPSPLAKPLPTAARTNPGAAMPAGPQWTINVPKYNPQLMLTDYQKLRRTSQTYFDKRLKILDDFYWQRDPSTPYIFAAAPNGTNLITQVQDTTVTAAVDKMADYATAKEVRHLCHPDDNPLCGYEQLRTQEQFFRHIWRHNVDQSNGRLSYRAIAVLIALRGGLAVQVAYLDPVTAQQDNGGEPAAIILHDLKNLAWEHGPTGKLRRVICAKKRLAGTLPLDWQKKIGNPDPDTEVDVLESWDEMNYMATAAGIAVVKSAPHGCIGLFGEPRIPFVLYLHNAHEVENGDVSFATTGTGISTGLVGVPPTLKLLETAKQRSFNKTLARVTLTDLGVPYVVIKGNVVRFSQERVFKTADTGASVEVLQAQGALTQIMNWMQYLDEETAQSGLSPGLLKGDGPVGDSNAAMGLQQTLPRAMMDQVRFGLEYVVEQVDILAAARVKWTNYPSSAQMYEARHGVKLNVSPTARVATNGNPHPLSGLITGNSDLEITSLTFAGFVKPRVKVRGTEQMPYADSLRFGVQLLSMKDEQTGEYPIPLRDIYTDYLLMDDPMGALYERRMEAEISRADTPFGILYGAEAFIREQEGMEAPEQIQSWRQQYSQARTQVIDSRLTSDLQRAMTLAQQATNPQQGGGAGQPPAPTASTGTPLPPPQGGQAALPPNVTPFPPQGQPQPPQMPGMPVPNQPVPLPGMGGPGGGMTPPQGAPQPGLFAGVPQQMPMQGMVA